MGAEILHFREVPRFLVCRSSGHTLINKSLEFSEDPRGHLLQ